MNKADLINDVSEDVGLSKRDTKIVIESVIKKMTTGILEDGKVSLVGFGSFVTTERKARTARNPKTGEQVDVPAKTAVKFKASQQLRNTLN